MMLHRVWFALCLCLGIASLALPAQAHTHEQALRITQSVDGAAQTQSVGLPDHLPDAYRLLQAKVQYEITLNKTASSIGQAAYIYRVGAPYKAYALQGDSAQPFLLQPMLPQRSFLDVWWEHLGIVTVFNGRVPVLLALPPQAHTLVIELLGPPYIRSGLVSVQIGEITQLAVRQSEDWASLSMGSNLVAGISMFIALLTLLLSWQRPLDLALRWFAVTCLVWGLRNSLYLNLTLPGLGYWAEQFLGWGIPVCGMTVSLCALHGAQLGERMRMLLRAMLIFLLLCYVLAWFWPASTLPVRLLGFLLAVLALGMGAWQFLLNSSSQMSRYPWIGRLLGAAFLFQILAGVLDGSIVLGWRPANSPVWVYWGFSALVMTLALLSGSRIVAELGRAERTNEELELRIDQANRQLQSQYEQALHAELTQERKLVLNEERERVNREMHDGLGAQLMSALRGLQRGTMAPEQLEAALQDGLDELRLMMDSSGIEAQLHSALMAWRSRWDLRLDALGIQLVWRVSEQIPDFGSQANLQVLRILQEAVANAVKHSSTSAIEVHAVTDEQQGLLLRVRDFGSGLKEGVPGGRGLGNMRQRAQAIGGTLQLASHIGGVSVQLRLPAPISA